MQGDEKELQPTMTALQSTLVDVPSPGGRRRRAFHTWHPLRITTAATPDQALFGTAPWSAACV